VEVTDEDSPQAEEESDPGIVVPMDDQRPVTLPSGGTFFVDKRETAYFSERVRRYLSDNHFTNVADLASLDQILVLELLVWRWGIWVSQQRDYWGDPIDEKGYGKQIKELAGELRQLKASLGIDKVTRDKQRGEESVDKYLANLRARAKDFGVKREKELGKALELFNELKSLVVLHYNSTDDERREMKVKATDVLEWIRDVAMPEYDKIDDHFRKNNQRFWIRDM
jgi:hypothetical protein